MTNDASGHRAANANATPSPPDLHSPADPALIDSRYAAWRLLATLALVTLGNGAMYVLAVMLPEDPCFGLGKFRRVGIFLSVLDVHVNRSPDAGTIEKTHYSAGEFLDARHLEVDIRNENQTWLLRTTRGPVLVRQIAGLIARRIVGWKKAGDSVSKGERFGMIRFGSRTDLYFPASCTPQVQVGQRVVGGQTILALWPA